jgi:hypothetical protein
MKHHPGQAFGIRGPSGADPGTRAPSTQLKTLGNSNGGNKYAALIALLDALEDTDELDGDTKGLRMDAEQPIPGQGAPETTGTFHDQQPSQTSGLPRRDLSPTPVKLPRQDSSCAVGDARLVHERRRAPEQRLDQHLRNHGMRSESARSYAVGLGRKQIAQDAAKAATAGDLDDFLRFCPGAAKIEALSPPVRSTTATRQSPIAQDAATATWTWQFNPMTNALEQVLVRRDQFNKG